MPGSRPPSAASFAASSVSGRHVAELGAHRLDRGEYVALGLFVSGLDRRAEYSAAGVDFPQHHRDVGSQARRPRVLGGKDLLDAPADLLLQVAAGRLPGRGRRPRASGGASEHLSQDVSADRGQHPDAGDGEGAGQIDGIGEDRPERRRAQPRQNRPRRDITPSGAAASRGPQHPLAQGSLQPLDLIELAQQGTPHPRITPQDGRQPSRRHAPGQSFSSWCDRLYTHLASKLFRLPSAPRTPARPTTPRSRLRARSYEIGGPQVTR